jgi:predicted acyltransferase
MRLTSLDVFRGLAIASMILVNNPGSWQHVYPPLRHAEWHGFTPTDLVFPAFIFIAGVAIAFSFAKFGDREAIDPSVYWKIARRVPILFVLGLLPNIFVIVVQALHHGEAIDLSTLRIMGVLQRIALAYGIGAIAILRLNRRQLVIFCAAILLGYWAALTWIPVPGYGPGDLSPKGEGTLVAYLDRLLLTPSHLLGKGNFDPEGLLSTLPATITLIFGYFTGDWLRQQPMTSQTSLQLAIAALCALVVGRLWGVFFPINKQLWTSSFVLYAAGWSLLLLACCYELIEVRRRRRWAFPFEVMGLNSIFLFVASAFLARILLLARVGSGEDAPSLYTWMYEHLFVPWAGELNGSLAIALTMVLFWWVVLYVMYRRRWFLKI